MENKIMSRPLAREAEENWDAIFSKKQLDLLKQDINTQEMEAQDDPATKR